MLNNKMHFEAIMKEKPFKIVVSSPKKKETDYKKIVILDKNKFYQVEKYTATKVFHENIENISEYAFDLTNTYSQFNFFTEEFLYGMKVTKKGDLLFNKTKNQTPQKLNVTHNRVKNYILEEGQVIEPLIDMGIFTQSGKIINSMYDKYKQINRFIEIIDDVIKKNNYQKLKILDFGCGKSYLTFIFYYYFTHIKKIDIEMIGLDLKEDVVNNCNETAKKYGYDNLRFEIGNINNFKSDSNIDMVISLHACDVATDYALFNAIKWDAKMIFVVPCCQHELNEQISTDTFKLLTRHGIVKERIAALFTDAIRSNLLECCSYKTQMLEFVDLSHTPKNILIRAIKTNVSANRKKEALQEIENIMQEFNLKPTLYTMLKDSGFI